MTKAIDIVNDVPRTELEVWQRWMNWMQAKYWSRIGKKIEVKHDAD